MARPDFSKVRAGAWTHWDDDTHLVVRRRSARRDGGSAIADALASIADADSRDVHVSVLCARCGSTAHGKPEVHLLHPAGVRWHASLSRADGWEAVGVSSAGPLGVDLVRIDAVGRHPLDAVLHPVETEALARIPEGARAPHLAALWSVKEAVLKASGDGLSVDPASIAVEVDSLGGAELRHRPAGLGAISWISVWSPDPGTVVAVARLP